MGVQLYSLQRGDATLMHTRAEVQKFGRAELGISHEGGKLRRAVYCSIDKTEERTRHNLKIATYLFECTCAFLLQQPRNP